MTVSTCQTCEEPLEPDAATCPNCGAAVEPSSQPESRLRGEVLDVERRQLAEEVSAESSLQVRIWDGVTYRPKADNVLKLLIRSRSEGVFRFAVRPDIASVVLPEPQVSVKARPNEWIQVAVPFFAGEAGEKVVRSLEVRVKRRSIQRPDVFDLMDHSVALTVGEATSPSVVIGSLDMRGAELHDKGVAVGDRQQVVNINTASAKAEPHWRDVAMMHDVDATRFESAARELRIAAAAHSQPLRRCQLLVEGALERRVFLVATREARFGRAKAYTLREQGIQEVNDFVLRVLPSRSAELDPENWKHTKVISSRHGMFQVVGEALFYLDTSTSGTRLDLAELHRGDRQRLRGESFTLRLGGGRAVLFGRVLKRHSTEPEQLVPPQRYRPPGRLPDAPPGFSSPFPIDGLWMRRDESAGATHHRYGVIFRELRLDARFEASHEDPSADRIRIIVHEGDILCGRLHGPLSVNGAEVRPGELVPLRFGMILETEQARARFAPVDDDDFTDVEA